MLSTSLGGAGRRNGCTAYAERGEGTSSRWPPSVISLAMITRVTRAAMLDILHEDYLRTARAKGLPVSPWLNPQTRG